MLCLAAATTLQVLSRTTEWIARSLSGSFECSSRGRSCRAQEQDQELDCRGAAESTSMTNLLARHRRHRDGLRSPPPPEHSHGKSGCRAGSAQSVGAQIAAAPLCRRAAFGPAAGREFQLLDGPLDDSGSGCILPVGTLILRPPEDRCTCTV